MQPLRGICRAHVENTGMQGILKNVVNVYNFVLQSLFVCATIGYKNKGVHIHDKKTRACELFCLSEKLLICSTAGSRVSYL